MKGDSCLIKNVDNPAKIVKLAPAKIGLLRAAAEEQLSPEDYKEFVSLLNDLKLYGLTPRINVQLGRLMAKIRWELEVEESPEWIEALQACDRAFLGRELKEMCYAYGLPISLTKNRCAEGCITPNAQRWWRSCSHTWKE